MDQGSWSIQRSEAAGDDTKAPRQDDPLHLVEEREPKTRVAVSASLANGQSGSTCEFLDEAISHIYRAGVFIRSRCQEAELALEGEVGHITCELDCAIRKLQLRALETQSLTINEFTPRPEYLAWSDREQQWVAMSFCRYQAWLSRPDLDPGQFASEDGCHEQ